jgi:hypothetical protein
MRAALEARVVAISAITRAELRYGQALLPVEAVRRSTLIDAFLAEMPVLEWGTLGGSGRGPGPDILLKVRKPTLAEVAAMTGEAARPVIRPG